VFIEIEGLKPDPLHIQHVYGINELKFKHQDAVLEEPVAADFVLTHKEKDLRVEGAVRTAIRYQCSRCLKDFSHPLNTGFNLFYLPQADWKRDEEIELKYEDMVIGYYDGIRLDIDLLVREQIELALPMKFICREDCRGLCPSCGLDLNEGSCGCKQDTTDPRLAVLREFRAKKQ
jgi:uncharacterized protein